MALLTCTVQAAISALNVVGTSALPAAFYGAKVWSKAHAQAHFLSTRHKEAEADFSVKSKSYTWAFSPAARELVREAGGFDSGRRWPFSNHSTLLSSYELLKTTNPSSCFVRHYSIVPKQVDASVDATQSVHTAALEVPQQEQSLVQRTFPVLYKWFSKVKPRVKGFSRKHVLRQINRRIVPRVARRLTIGIPVLGFYFVSKLMTKDLARAKSEYLAGNTVVASLFASALAADALDLAAQLTIISGIAHAHLGVGLAGAAALLVQADNASLVLAALSFTCGLGGELLTIASEEAPKDE